MWGIHFPPRAERTLAAETLVGKIYAPPRETIQSSSVVERSAVNRLVVGSNPTSGATPSLPRKRTARCGLMGGDSFLPLVIPSGVLRKQNVVEAVTQPTKSARPGFQYVASKSRKVRDASTSLSMTKWVPGTASRGWGGHDFTFAFRWAHSIIRIQDAGWSSLVARQAHNLKAAGSNPARNLL